MNYCVIPIKKNSTRIPNKWMATIGIHGETLFDEVYKQCVASNIFDRIIISGDIKPPNISCDDFYVRNKDEIDDPSVLIVIDHFIKNTHINDGDTLTLIYAHAIFTKAQDLILAHKMCKRYPDFYSIIAVSDNRKSLRSLTEEKKYLFEEYKYTPSQYLPQIYMDAGQFYIFNLRYYKSKQLLDEDSIYYMMPCYTIDIDYPAELEASKALFNYQFLTI